MLNDFVVSLLKQFDVLSQEIGSMEKIESPRKYDESLPRESQSRLHLRYAGRKLKLLGDLQLMAGAFSEAVASYAGASEETKAINDYLWNAGAQEGLQIALCLQHVSLLDSSGDASRDLLVSLPVKLRDVAIAYEKTVMPRLAFELLLQIATICESQGEIGEACFVLTHAWNCCRPLVVYEKLVVLGTLVKRFERLGLRRKALFYRQRLAQHLSNLQYHSMALQALQNEAVLKPLRLNQPFGWVELKWSLTERIAELAEASHSYAIALKNHFDCLSNAHVVMDGKSQQAISDRLFHLRRKLFTSKPIQIDSEVINFSLQPQLDNSITASSPTTNSSTPTVLLHNPFSKKIKRPLESFLVEGESVRWLVSVKNPFLVPLELKGVHLVADKGLMLSEELDVSLDAIDGEPFEFYIQTKAKSTGKLTVQGISFSVFDHLMVNFKIPKQVFQVVPALPYLNLSTDSSRQVELYEGETRELILRIENVADVEAQFMVIQISYEWASRSPMGPLEEAFLPFSNAPVKLSCDILSISPKDAVQIPLTIAGVSSLYRLGM